MKRVIRRVQESVCETLAAASLVADVAVERAISAGAGADEMILSQEFLMACARVAALTKGTTTRSVGLRSAAPELRRAIVSAGDLLHRTAVSPGLSMRLLDPFLSSAARMWAANARTNVHLHFYARQRKVVRLDVEIRLLARAQQLGRDFKTREDKKKLSLMKLALTKKAIKKICGLPPPTFKERTIGMLSDEVEMVRGIFESVHAAHVAHLPDPPCCLDPLKLRTDPACVLPYMRYLLQQCRKSQGSAHPEGVRRLRAFKLIPSLRMRARFISFDPNSVFCAMRIAGLVEAIPRTLCRAKRRRGRRPRAVNKEALSKFMWDHKFGWLPEGLRRKFWGVFSLKALKDAQWQTFGRMLRRIEGGGVDLMKHLFLSHADEKKCPGSSRARERLLGGRRVCPRFKVMTDGHSVRFYYTLSDAEEEGADEKVDAERQEQPEGGSMKAEATPKVKGPGGRLAKRDVVKGASVVEEPAPADREQRKSGSRRSAVAPGSKGPREKKAKRTEKERKKSVDMDEEWVPARRDRRKGGSRKRKAKPKSKSPKRKKKKGAKSDDVKSVPARDEEKDEKQPPEPQCYAELEDDDENEKLKLVTEADLLKRHNTTSEYKIHELGTVVTDMKPRNVIYMGVDPGHANLMTGGAVVYDQPVEHKLEKPTTKAQRRAQQQERLAALGVCKYSLTNKAYRCMTDATRSQVEHEQRLLLPENKDWLAAQRALSETHKAENPTEEHVKVCLEHFNALKRQAFSPHLRKNRWRRFTSTQRSYRKIAAQIRATVHKLTRRKRKIKGKIVLVWGAGSLGPTLRGHASAPNKKLRKGLSAFFPIVMCSEYKTSKVCGATGCSESVKHGKGPYSKKYIAKMRKKCQAESKECKVNEESRKKIRGLFHCPRCGITWDRDFSAALSILKIFRHQSDTQSLTRPAGYENTYA